MTAQFWVFILSLAGFTGLMLSMPAHFNYLTRQTLNAPLGRVLRFTGWLLLIAAVILAIVALQGDIGFVNWLGWLTIAGLVIAFYLPYWPWQVKRPEKTPRASKKKTATPETPVAQNSQKTAGVAAVLMISIAGIVSWNFYTNPEKPLLRDDVYHGEVGPWTFAIVERDTKAPEVAALNLGVKDFVLRFCESCNAEIRSVYIKIRQPRTLRTAGVSFFGSRERFSEMAIPPNATLEDGLWLTVVSKKGEVFETRMDIERISPKMAEFIRNQS